MSKTVPSTSVHRGPARPAGARRRPVLVCAHPRPLALPFPDSGVLVGRTWLEEAGLGDSEVSAAHLRFDRAGGALQVVDVGSRNGTWLNAQPLSAERPVPLSDGAVLRVGRTLFVVRERFEGPLDPAPPVGDMVGPFGLRPVASAIAALAESPVTNVLIEGETGVGKELTARALAAALGRDAAFGAVNVAGVASGVFESQMFGHVAGAFSGAGQASAGVVVAHDGGTLFLDEIGELDLALQAKLLRLLDNREVMAVGAHTSREVDVLVVAATHCDLGAMVEAGTFRRDLWMRLSMARIVVPSLRERSEDMFSLTAALAKRAGRDFVADAVEVEAIERLVLEPWPGNLRELAAALAAAARLDPAPGLRLWALEEVLGRAQHVPALTEEVVEAAVAAAGGNVTRAAAALGVSRGKLLRLRNRTP